jgi:hypothetical protein
MMLFAYDSLIRIAIPANSGWYTAPDSGVIFPWGVQHSLLSISPAQVKEYTNRPMVIMRGTADTVRDANLNVDPLSDAQGKNRYQRAGYFFQKGKNVNPASLWKLVDVVGSGHDYQKMAIAAGTYLLSPNGINRTFTQIPQRIMLQNYPNPFNPSTEIAFSLDHSSKATLELYSLLGQKAATIVDEYLEAGVYRKYFDGSTLSNGTYFCVLRSAQTQATIKLVLIK